MKKSIISLFFCAALKLQGLEYEQLFENEQIWIAKVCVAAHEEIAAHRDADARVVIATKGGTITRIEQNGSTRDVHFPTAKAVFLEPDPENELHTSVNNSSEPVELMIIGFKERENKVISQSDETICFEKYKKDIIDTMQKLSLLIANFDND